MIFAKPSFKLAIGCIILWSLLAAIIIPNADKWFKGKSSSVKEGKNHLIYTFPQKLTSYTRCCCFQH